MAKVPHEVPVENEIKAERANAMTGMRAMGKPPPTTASLRYAAKPSPPSSGLLLMTVPMVQAMVRMMRAGTMLLIPSPIASLAPLMVKSLRPM